MVALDTIKNIELPSTMTEIGNNDPALGQFALRAGSTPFEKGDMFVYPADTRIFKNTQYRDALCALALVVRKEGSKYAVKGTRLVYFSSFLKSSRSYEKDEQSNIVPTDTVLASDGEVVGAFRDQAWQVPAFLAEVTNKVICVQDVAEGMRPAWDREVGRPSTAELQLFHVWEFELVHNGRKVLTLNEDTGECTFK